MAMMMMMVNDNGDDDDDGEWCMVACDWAPVYEASCNNSLGLVSVCPWGRRMIGIQVFVGGALA